MISVDSSLIPALIIFLGLIFALNSILFKPLVRILAERRSRTSGLMDGTRAKLDNQTNLFNKYRASIKNARMEGYRRQEQLRAEAMAQRAELLAQARNSAESLIRESRDSIHAQVEAEKQQLARDAREMARHIASSLLGRQVADTDTP